MRKLALVFVLALLLVGGCSGNEMGVEEEPETVELTIRNNSFYDCHVYLSYGSGSFDRFYARTGETTHSVRVRDLDRAPFYFVIDPIGEGAGIDPAHPERHYIAIGPFDWIPGSRLVLDIEQYAPTSNGALFPERS